VTEADLSTPRPMRALVAIFVILLHIIAVGALVRAFAPEFTAEVTDKVVEAITVVTITAPPPPPPEKADATPQGAEGAVGKQAVPKEVAAPKPKVAIAQKSAPAAASTGTADTSGARDAGDGTGAGGASKPVKIAGDIKSARDYPREGREARNGDYVIVALTVGTDGRVKACRVHRASRDAEADRITCELATRRFRFKPATDHNGQPVEGVYGWQQRWFDKGEN
jgi:periplasmic protein TonB